MKALAVYPGIAHSIHLKDVPMPRVTDISNGRGVLVRVLRAGACATDREIAEGLYGRAPEGEEFLILGHENVGVVVEAGPNVPSTLQPGAYVVATVRRPGQSIYDQINMQDMTTDDVYYERGINLRHGYMAEYYVEDADHLVPLPGSLREVGVLLEPLSVSEKGLNQAFEIQRRLKIWQPRRAAVLGAGPIGLLAALALRVRGMEVVCYSRELPPSLKSDLIAEIGARYSSSREQSLAAVSAQHGPFDIIVEATGFSPLIFEAAADALAPNGALILESVTGGDRTVEIPADRINQSFVLGNKVMFGSVNASRADFVNGMRDMVAAEALFPGWLSRLLTTPVYGLENYEEMLRHLNENSNAIKVFVEVAQQPQQSQERHDPTKQHRSSRRHADALSPTSS